MRKLNITFATILLVLGCFTLSPAVKAAPPIVGMWDVIYTSDFGPSFETHDQWHSDGLEIEINSLGPGTICQGTWKQTADRAIQVHHVGFTFGVAPCSGTYRLEETQLITVSLDRNSYEGRYRQQFLDADGNVVCEDTGTVQGTRISVDQPSTTARR
jgi:hypothetical protein